jgi:hypothetical protein
MSVLARPDECRPLNHIGYYPDPSFAAKSSDTAALHSSAKHPTFGSHGAIGDEMHGAVGGDVCEIECVIVVGD